MCVWPGTLERTVTQAVADAMGDEGGEGTGTPSVGEYIEGVHSAMAEHGHDVTLKSMRQAFNRQRQNDTFVRSV